MLAHSGRCTDQLAARKTIGSFNHEHGFSDWKPCTHYISSCQKVGIGRSGPSETSSVRLRLCSPVRFNCPTERVSGGYLLPFSNGVVSSPFRFDAAACCTARRQPRRRGRVPPL